jgi:hypothetical protein
LLLAVKWERPEGDRDKKLQPCGIPKLVMGWALAEALSVSISNIDTIPGSFAIGGAAAAPCVGGN